MSYKIKKTFDSNLDPIYMSMSEVADYLLISQDTIRRWDKVGKLKSFRLDGKNRFFLMSDIKILKENEPLTTGQVAVLLNVSLSTVRRLEYTGQLIPERAINNNRIYSRSSLQLFLKSRESNKSEYYLNDLNNIHNEKNSTAYYFKNTSNNYLSTAGSIIVFLIILLVYFCFVKQ